MEECEVCLMLYSIVIGENHCEVLIPVQDLRNIQQTPTLTTRVADRV